MADEHERLMVTLSSIGDGFIATDPSGRVTLMNGVAERLTGWNEAEAIGRPLREIFHIFDQKTGEPIDNPAETVLETGAIVRLANHTILRSREGIERSIADSAAPIRDRGGNTIGVVLVFRDVTEQQRMHDALVKAMKLESISLLAAVIAHDFNNILTAILGNVSLAKLDLAPNDLPYLRLSETEKAATKAKDLAYQLLTFSKGESSRKQVVSIVELVKESAHFALRGSNVRAEFYFAHNLWAVNIDEGQMTQVVHNLVINAQHAMPQGGVILIKGENLKIEEEAGKLGIPQGNFISLSFQDTGTGIPKKYIDKIFDPFFTTKEKGSGLGLFSTYSIIKIHGGNITVTSQEGVGTTFFVYLPAITDGKILQKEGDDQILRGSGRILVVDDNEMVRKTAEAMLQTLGYEVEEASSGDEAVQIYQNAKETGHSFDALILDLTLPGGTSGMETLQKLIAYDPDVKAVISSGYTEDPAIAKFQEFGFKDYLAKPYQIGLLSRVLYQVLKS